MKNLKFFWLQINIHNSVKDIIFNPKAGWMLPTSWFSSFFLKSPIPKSSTAFKDSLWLGTHYP